jgi:hypothetical protein
MLRLPRAELDHAEGPVPNAGYQRPVGQVAQVAALHKVGPSYWVPLVLNTCG